jgi:hypothetical protein
MWSPIIPAQVLDAGIQDGVEDFYSPKIKDDEVSRCWRRTSIAAGCLSDRPKNRMKAAAGVRISGPANPMKASVPG